MSLLLEQDHVILHGVSWQTFQQLLTDGQISSSRREQQCGISTGLDVCHGAELSACIGGIASQFRTGESEFLRGNRLIGQPEGA